MLRCSQCGLVRADVIPPHEELKRLYSKDYFRSADSAALGYEDYMADRDKISKTFRKRLQEIEEWIGRKGTLLDVGCATGFSLEAASARGWDAQGIEISEFACTFARSNLGIDILCGSLEETDFEPETFDVITMWDYIEHCADPASQLAHASRLLKTGGLLALTTPDIASLPARIWGSRWMGIKRGEHLYYFSPTTIKHLLRRFGFEPVRLEHVGKYIDADFFVKRIGLYSSVMERLLRQSIQLLGIGHRVLYVNPFDIMLVYAEKLEAAE
jgi:2-polyprenyl-3-methyl-5-hydroxy-6-metoxy-1,4-benzoquinol methylase